MTPTWWIAFDATFGVLTALAVAGTLALLLLMFVAALDKRLHR